MTKHHHSVSGKPTSDTDVPIPDLTQIKADIAALKAEPALVLTEANVKALLLLAGGSGGTTPPTPPVDTTPPVVANIVASPYSTTAATVSWSTNEPATGQIEYGPTTGYGSTTTLDSTLSLTKSQSITGLSPSTTYHYRILAVDAASNAGASADHTFATGSASSSVTVSSIAALKAALSNDTLTEIVVANGTYAVSGAGNLAPNSLWIGAAYAGRTTPVLVRAQTVGGVIFDGGGATYYNALRFVEGAHHQTWQGFTFAHGEPTQTGVIVFGGVANVAPAHHITLLDITIASTITSADTVHSNEHGIYFSWAANPGCHDILVDRYTVNSPSVGMVDTAFTFFHSDASNANAHDVTIRHLTVSGTQEACQIWDTTAYNITIEDAAITTAREWAVHYEHGSAVVLRRVVSTGAGHGFYSSLGPTPPEVTFDTCSFA